MSSSISIFQLEQERVELISRAVPSASNNLRLQLYSNYIEKVLSQKSSLLEAAYLPEIIEGYLSCLQRFDIWGTDPLISQSIIELAGKTVPSSFVLDRNNDIQTEISRLKDQLTKLNSSLNGSPGLTEMDYKATFPMINFEALEGFHGILESVSVRINKTNTGDKFIIIPSEKEIEKQMHDQCVRSWTLALNLASRYIKKLHGSHEVIISFDRKDQFYEGKSLGISFTLTYLEALLDFYNSPYVIAINKESAFTGGISQSGEIFSTGEEIINKKIYTVFFSTIENFVYPKNDEQYANQTETALKTIYPNRKLNLVPVKDINDILNRRDLIDIRKQKISVRTAKLVRKNWLSAAVVILLTLLLSYYFSFDFDDNPATLASDFNTLYVKNQSGKVLWSERVKIDSQYIQKSAKIIDIENDGENEVLLIKDGLRLLDKAGKNIRNYQFLDQVTSPRESLNAEYSLSLLDTISLNGSKRIFMYSSNRPSFSSAIFSLDLFTWERAPGTLWCSGHIISAIIKDINYDNIPEILGVGYDNGFEDAVFFVFEINDKTAVRPTTNEYTIANFPKEDFKAYIRFPKKDYDIFNQLRTPSIDRVLWDFPEDSCYHFSTFLSDKQAEIGYRINYNFSDIEIVIGSSFRVRRDSAVARGEIRSPFKKTDSNEYKNEIKRNILYWKNNIWVHREDLD